MAGKLKFQISRLLDDRIKRVVAGSIESESEYLQASKAYILGFNYGNVTNYIGLTSDYKLHHAGFPVLGLAFFKGSPNEDEIKSNLKSLQEFSDSSDGPGSFKSDQSKQLFLIYSADTDAGDVVKKIFHSNDGYLSEQPKLSVLDEAKIYNHSAIAKLNLCLRLDKNGTSDTAIARILECFRNDSKNLKIHLEKSNFSSGTSANNSNLVETLYDFLDPPADLEQMGDYLPQMSKKDKEEMLKKWRNKVKTQRSPLTLNLEHSELSIPADDDCPADCVKLNLESYLLLHVNDPISKAMKILLFAVRNRLELLKLNLRNCELSTLEPDEIKSCTFKPKHLGHLVPAIYRIPETVQPDYDQLLEIRSKMHSSYLLPSDQPIFRYSQRILNVDLKNSDEIAGYLCNVHAGIVDSSGVKGGSRNLTQGTYTYHHYMQNRASDSGWGCAYRSLQTIISWFKHQGHIYSPDVKLREPPSSNANTDDKISSLRKKLHSEGRAPTHEEIQTVLVDVGDKQPSFIGSQRWIGSQEVCYVLSHLYNLESKFISVSSGSELMYKARDLGQHFAQQGTPVMIGGGVLAHTIIGVDFNDKNGDLGYLILDPHYTGGEDLSVITKKGWCGWKKNSFWDKQAFYNLCLPQVPNGV